VGNTRTIPQKPVVFRIRTDLNWRDVVGYSGNKSSKNGISLLSPYHLPLFITSAPFLRSPFPCFLYSPLLIVLAPNFFNRIQKKSQHDFWTIVNIRRSFEKYARENWRDPLVPETWYNISSVVRNKLTVSLSLPFFSISRSLLPCSSLQYLHISISPISLFSPNISLSLPLPLTYLQGHNPSRRFKSYYHQLCQYFSLKSILTKQNFLAAVFIFTFSQ
jgi:hypothetical protein